jgi:hypothetical protein
MPDLKEATWWLPAFRPPQTVVGVAAIVLGIRSLNRNTNAVGSPLAESDAGLSVSPWRFWSWTG